ncbi:hypothetical protein ABK905_26495 [Acerihabitans sp. KWT182]|uniref:Arginase family protein n=1 Tax=Acerihabitans sp. KWT182 TaxID=3157919 RepID=A0AAU7Q9X6_9GAMM
MTRCPAPLILNFDDTVRSGNIGGAMEIPLQPWQESIRFGCPWSGFRRLAAELEPQLAGDHGCVFTGSGDFHHLTHLLLQRLVKQPPFILVVCDNHPDNMRYPFGIHCGSWVYWASRLPQVTHIHVLGIGSSDIAVSHAWENHWRPLLRKKLTYWNINIGTGWLNWLGAKNSSRRYGDADGLITDFLSRFAHDGEQPVYLSIDKDVLSPQVVNTNWDQGSFEERHLNQLIDACRGRLIGADITGEVSVYRYKSRFKRWLSAADGQSESPAAEAAAWQQRQNQLNQRLLGRLDGCWR